MVCLSARAGPRPGLSSTLALFAGLAVALTVVVVVAGAANQLGAHRGMPFRVVVVVVVVAVVVVVVDRFRGAIACWGGGVVVVAPDARLDVVVVVAVVAVAFAMAAIRVCGCAVRSRFCFRLYEKTLDHLRPVPARSSAPQTAPYWAASAAAPFPNLPGPFYGSTRQAASSTRRIQPRANGTVRALLCG